MSRILFPTVVGSLAAQIDAEPMIGTRAGGIEEVPAGLHRCSVLLSANWHHSWLIMGADDVVVPTGARAEVTSTEQLVRFPLERAALWSALTAHLARRNRCEPTGEGPSMPVIGRVATPPVAADALAASLEVYGGVDGVLAAIEQSFVEGFLTPDTGDPAAIARWRRLLAIVAGGGAAAIAARPELFVGVVSVIAVEIELLGAELLDDGFLYELDLLANELIGASDPQVALSGIELEQRLFSGPAPSSPERLQHPHL